MSKTLEDIILSMTPEEYKLTVGNYSEEPLKYAFEKKRVVHPGVGGRPLSPIERHVAWEKAMQMPAKEGKRTAYIHIPFCSNICLYCGFFQNYSDEERETLYIDHLITELKMAQADSYVNGGLFHAIFIGGGTPSALSPYNARRLLQAIHQYLPLANDCELTLEARIHDLVEDKMEAWFANGVNRVSIGVQSFDTNIRKTMGRLDPREVVLERLQKLASYNQASIIIDLIYGLPGQSMKSLLADLAIVDTLPIEGMDLYQLNLFEVSPLKKAIDAGLIPPAATTAQQAMMFAVANEWLSERAYMRLSNCHWAKSNRERNMYNLLTKQGTEVFPFGAGAGGNIGEYGVFLQRELKAYVENLAKGEKPILFMGNRSEFQSLHNDMLRQLEQGYFNIEFLAAKYGAKIRQLDYLLTIWQKNGLVKRGKILTRLTVAGQFWHMNIAQSLLECAERILEQDVKIEVQPIAEQG